MHKVNAKTLVQIPGIGWEFQEATKNFAPTLETFKVNQEEQNW